MIRSGKHKGKTWDDLKKDRPYCEWLIRAHREQPTLPKDLKRFAASMTEEHGGILSVGVHKNKWFDDVVKQFPDYAEWAEELSAPSASIKHFAEYVKKHKIGPTDKNKCCVCVDRSVQVAFVPCGHYNTCEKCSASLSTCPVCRRDIIMSLKIYD